MKMSRGARRESSTAATPWAPRFPDRKARIWARGAAVRAALGRSRCIVAPLNIPLSFDQLRRRGADRLDRRAGAVDREIRIACKSDRIANQLCAAVRTAVATRIVYCGFRQIGGPGENLRRAAVEFDSRAHGHTAIAKQHNPLG